MSHESARQLYTEREAANLLALSVRTLQGLRVRGGGPRFARIGRARGRIRYDLADLNAYIDERLRTSTSDRGGA